MNTKLLFPPVFKIIGIALLLPGLVLGYLIEYTYYIIPFLRYRNDLMWKGAGTLVDELAITLLVTGLIFLGFSELKKENKKTAKLRLDALYWSVVVNWLLISAYFIIQFLGDFLKVPIIKLHEDFGSEMIIYNFFTPLAIFVCRFYYVLYLSGRKKEIKPLYFLPYKPYSLIGKIASIPFIIILIAGAISDMISIDIFPGIDIQAIIFIGFPAFLLLWIWSKEKNEIAQIKNTRLKAMQIAVYINYSLFLIATWLIYGLDYWTVISICLISIQIIFLIVFYYQLFLLKKKHIKIALTNL